MTRSHLVVAGIALSLAVAVPERAQGEQGKGKGPKSHPPSHSLLPSPATGTPSTAGAVPFAWIDDASVLPAGTVAVSTSVMGWRGTDLSEFYAPIIGVSAGFTPRLQIGASVPRLVGDAASGIVGGLGSTYFSGKFAVLTAPSAVKLAVAPTIEILGADTVQAPTSGASRTQFGLPVSLEIDHNKARVFASCGFFSQGVWFVGAGVGGQVARRVSVSAGFSRAWTTNPIAEAPGDRREVFGSVAFSPRSALALFGSLGQTIATADQDGAGMTVTGGLMVLIPSLLRK